MAGRRALSSDSCRGRSLLLLVVTLGWVMGLRPWAAKASTMHPSERLRYRFVSGRTLVYDVRMETREMWGDEPATKSKLGLELRITTEWVAPGGVSARQRAAVRFLSRELQVGGREPATAEQNRRWLERMNRNMEENSIRYYLSGDGRLVTTGRGGKVVRDVLKMLLVPFPEGKGIAIRPRLTWTGYLARSYLPSHVAMEEMIRVQYGIDDIREREGEKIVSLCWSGRPEFAKREPKWWGEIELFDMGVKGRGAFDLELGAFRRIEIDEAKIRLEPGSHKVRHSTSTIMLELRSVEEGSAEGASTGPTELEGTD